MTEDRFQSQRERMVEYQLRSRGIEDARVLDAMRTVPRELFLPPGARSHAYQDRALPLSQGQTISQPYMVAAMTEGLRLQPGERVLEIGTGSGYQTAVLAETAGAVYTIERLESLAVEARRVLTELGYENVVYRVCDGTLGWPEEAPFDGILVTAGAPEAPPSLRAQLSEDGGRLVIPVGTRSLQELMRYERRGTEVTAEKLMACRFVPLTGAEGWSSRRGS